MERNGGRCYRYVGLMNFFSLYLGVCLFALDQAAACATSWDYDGDTCPTVSQINQLASVIFGVEVPSSILLSYPITREKMDPVVDKSGETSEPQKTVRILCFGDSLTAGYMLTSRDRFPYGDVVQTELAKSLSVPLTNVKLDIDGLPGDQVSGAYMRRLKRRLEKAVTSPYDFIVVMGGTNDLGWGQPAHVIFHNLKLVWQKALDSGASVVALNIIETSRASPGLLQRRADLNNLIASHKQDRFHPFDLWSVVRYTGLDEEAQARIWDDGLHLTATGYEIMGKAVAVCLTELIQDTQPESKVLE